ncbi:MAG: hypothetical protein Q7S40_24515 [Opitutaceae bacterium]|nr:hypothetical protein [Opitutaceae bacterium]
MKTKILLFIAAGCGATLASAQPRIGISVRIGVPPPVIVHEAPPQPIPIEYQSSAPWRGPNQVWVRSHHRWVDGRWHRVQGGWVVPPRPDAVWVEGRWDARTQSWTEEHWEISRPSHYARPDDDRSRGYATPNGPPPPPYASRGRPESSGRGSNYYGEGRYGEMFVGSAPPPPRAERWSTRPSRQHVWLAGYWMASHGRHEWVSGHWEVPPRERSTWIAPRWEQRDRNFLFVQGYWR